MIHLLLLGTFASVNAHGMLFYAGPMPSSDTKGAIRDYHLVDHQIDRLRNPLDYPSICRGASPRPPIPIQLSDGKDFQVTLAFSIGAQHIGPCTVEILDADDLSKPGVVIASAPSNAGCAVKPIAQFSTDKGSPATSQCPGKVPAGLVTDDMCLNTWTFKPINVEKISCKNCVLRWTWEGHHISAINPEKFENCIDVTINKYSAESRDSFAVSNSSDILPSKEKITKKEKKEGSNKEIKAVKQENSDQPSSPTEKVKKIDEKAKSKSSGCACDLSIDANIYSQCTSDGNYCTCFSGPWSALGKVKTTCAPGTSCSQSGVFINCI